MESWESCLLDYQQSAEVQKLEDLMISKQMPASKKNSYNVISSKVVDHFSSTSSTVDTVKMLEVVEKAEVSCSHFLNEIDIVLDTLSTLSTSYDDVTSRTNSLMRSCEDLLEQQQQLQATIDSLEAFLIPFNDIEEISTLLGIPVDSKYTGPHSTGSTGIGTNNNNNNNNNTSSTALTTISNNEFISMDPRSTEFQNILLRLNQCHINLYQYQNFKDYEKYKKWLDQLTTRATSLVAKAMRDLLENAFNICQDYTKKLQFSSHTTTTSNMKYQPTSTISTRHPASSAGPTNTNTSTTTFALYTVEETPLESAPIYQKFRGLGFRMRELLTLLQLESKITSSTTTTNANANSSNSKSNNYSNNYEEISESPSSPSLKKTPRQSSYQQATIFIQLDKVINDIKQYYVSIRNALLYPFLKEYILKNLLKKSMSASSLLPVTSSREKLSAGHMNSPSKSTLDSTVNTQEIQNSTQTNIPLYHGIYQAFSILLRIAQLEHHLYMNLFHIATNTSTNTTTVNTGNITTNISPYTTPRADSSSSISVLSTYQISTQSLPYSTEVLSIIENATNIIIDCIRPLIIQESFIDELCHIITILNEDIRIQFMNMSTSSDIVKDILIRHLDRIISDTQERLSYCVETFIRIHINMYEPLPSHLSYPDILEKASTSGVNSTNADQAHNGTKSGTEMTKGSTNMLNDSFLEYESPFQKIDVSEKNTLTVTNNTSNTDNNILGNTDNTSLNMKEQIWYPPLQDTLLLLSKLYDVVDMNIFEDIARRCVKLCVQSLLHSSEKIKRKHTGNSSIHGDLFLIRNLLILREQLQPFEIKLQSTEQLLDFKNTRIVLNNIAINPKNIIRFDQYNSIFQLAREGLPSTLEKQIDIKLEMDQLLRTHVRSFQTNAMKYLFPSLIAFILKIEVILGEEINIQQYKPSIKLKAMSSTTTNATTVTSSNIVTSGSISNSETSSAIMTTTSNDDKDKLIDNHNNKNIMSTINTDGNTVKLVAIEHDEYTMSENHRILLKNQLFMNSEKVKELVETSYNMCKELSQELKHYIRLYIENNYARTTLMKPLVQEIDILKQKIEIICINIYEANSSRKSIEQLLISMMKMTISELNK